MQTAIIFDCEFLTNQASPSRFWCGPQDPDPVIVQIGAVKLGLEGEFPILETIMLFIKPIDRYGDGYEIDPFFTQLTGISKEIINEKGKELQATLDNLDNFSGGANFWSWGKDEFNMLAISCYVENICPPIPAKRFDNACKLLLRAGMPQEDLNKTRSNNLMAYYGLDSSKLSAHGALDDALSVASVLQYLLVKGALNARDLQNTNDLL